MQIGRLPQNRLHSNRLISHTPSIFAVCFWITVQAWIPTVVFGQPSAEPPPDAGLDDELFQSLGGLASEKPALPAVPPTEGNPQRAPTPGGPALPTTAADRWRTLQQQMRGVQQRLRQADVGPMTTRMQQQIVEELRKLIQQIPEGSALPATGAESAERSSEPTNRRRPPGETPQTPTSTSRDVAPSSLTNKSLNPRELLESSWGHLPANVREKLQSVGPEQFLPEYSQQIEQYFRSISESGPSVP